MEVCELSLRDFEQEARAAGVALPIEQTRAWADYQGTIDGRRPWGYVAARRDGVTVALASFVDFETHGYHYLRSVHGPVWVGEPSAQDEHEFLKALRAFVAKADKRQMFVRLAVKADDELCQPTLSTVPYDATVVISLEGDGEAILSRMKPRGRRDVRKAVREAPITCADETAQATASFAEYYDVMVETSQRDGFAPAPMADYENMLRLLGPDHCRLFAGRNDEGRVVTWSLVTISDGHATRYYAASLSETMRLHVTDRLVFFECCSLAEEGIASTYDLMGIGSEFSPSLMGLNEFKTKFSKEVVAVAPDRDLPVHQLFYTALAKARAFMHRGDDADEKKDEKESDEKKPEKQPEKKAAPQQPAPQPEADGNTATRLHNLAFIKGEEDLAERLQPVVCGADILGYAYVRSYHEAYGIKPIVLSTVDVKVTSSSKFCDYRVEPAIDEEEGLIKVLSELGAELAAAGKVGILHGSADWNTRIISAHKDELSEWYVVPYIDFALLDDITQKERFYALCEELGIAYPKTWYIDCAADTEPLDTSAFTYPLVAKPSNSASYDLLDFPGKKKVYEIETPEELERAVNAVRASAYEHKLVVQDYIPGGDDAIRSLTTYSDENGVLRVVAGGRVVLQDHSPLALGNPVCILSERVQRIIDDASKFLAHVGYRGYANFDIKYDKRDDSYRFFEVNTRPGKNTFYVSLGGVNFVKPIVEDWVLGREVAYAEAYDPYVYTVVPPEVVKKTVEDRLLRSRVLAMYREKRAHSPYDYAPDTLQHKLWAAIKVRNQVPKFKRFVWDTGGKQADVD